MKRLFLSTVSALALLIASSCTPVYAVMSSNTCAGLATFATTVAEGRDKGVSSREFVKVAMDSKASDPTKSLLIRLIYVIYDSPNTSPSRIGYAVFRACEKERAPEKAL